MAGKAKAQARGQYACIAILHSVLHPLYSSIRSSPIPSLTHPTRTFSPRITLHHTAQDLLPQGVCGEGGRRDVCARSPRIP